MTQLNLREALDQLGVPWYITNELGQHENSEEFIERVIGIDGLIGGAVDEAKEEAYEQGLNDGYNDGHDDGYDQGEAVGFEEGHQAGYDAGFAAGEASAVSSDWARAFLALYDAGVRHDSEAEEGDDD